MTRILTKQEMWVVAAVKAEVNARINDARSLTNALKALDLKGDKKAELADILSRLKVLEDELTEREEILKAQISAFLALEALEGQEISSTNATIMISKAMTSGSPFEILLSQMNELIMGFSDRGVGVTLVLSRLTEE